MTTDDAERDAEIDRRAARYRAEEAEVEKLKERERLRASADASAAMERNAAAALAVAKARQAPAAAGYKSKYTGPVANRGTDAQGRALVSREELADFQKKYGADKTLRDLLNADKGMARRGAPASSATDMRARGLQGVNRLTEDMYPAARDMYLGREQASPADRARTAEIMGKEQDNYRKGGKVKTYAKGGVTRADGCAQRGKTKGRFV